MECEWLEGAIDPDYLGNYGLASALAKAAEDADDRTAPAWFGGACADLSVHEPPSPLAILHSVPGQPGETRDQIIEAWLASFQSARSALATPVLQQLFRYGFIVPG